MNCHHLRSMSVVAMLLGTSGCMGTESDSALPGQNAGSTMDEPAEIAPTHIALQTAASAEPGDNDGYCENGAGVLLSALGDAATLTVYVVPPAEIVTFERSMLHVTSQQADGEVTEVTELDAVTLETGESWSFSAQAPGTLMSAAVEVDAMVL